MNVPAIISTILTSLWVSLYLSVAIGGRLPSWIATSRSELEYDPCPQLQPVLAVGRVLGTIAVFGTLGLVAARYL